MVPAAVRNPMDLPIKTYPQLVEEISPKGVPLRFPSSRTPALSVHLRSPLAWRNDRTSRGTSVGLLCIRCLSLQNRVDQEGHALEDDTWREVRPLTLQNAFLGHLLRQNVEGNNILAETYGLKRSSTERPSANSRTTTILCPAPTSPKRAKPFKREIETPGSK